MEHFADRLSDAVQRVGSPVCVGLDPVLERLPVAVEGDSPTRRIEAFCRGVVDAVVGKAAMVKPQLACFERYGSAGWAVYERVVEHAGDRGLLVLAEAKRGEIGISAAHYAAALLEGDHAADAVTVNPYLGPDALDPFIATAARVGGGVFALVRTSNPGSDALQTLQLADGRTVAEAVADTVRESGAKHVGAGGESLLGAVVGATQAEDAASLRKRMPEQVFLLPGYGAQGATADDVRGCFHPQREGESLPRGAIVTASRSVMYAFENKPGDWQDAVGTAARRFADEVREAVLR